MNKIPQGRALFYLVLLCLIPSFFAIYWIHSQRTQLNFLETRMESVRESALLKEKRQSVNQIVRSHYKGADNFYIDNSIESLTFLEPEIEGLKKILNQTNFPEDEQAKRRLDVLTGPQNRLIFSEGVVQNYGIFKETAETMVHPVEVNVQDLHKILSSIEGSFTQTSNDKRPHLIITEFKMDKKKTNDKNEVFLLNMKLLKREYL